MLHASQKAGLHLDGNEVAYRCEAQCIKRETPYRPKIPNHPEIPMTFTARIESEGKYATLEDSYRLMRSTTKKHKSAKQNYGFKDILHGSIDAAKIFHDTLQLKAHSNTTVSGSFGKDTVLKIDITLNKDNVLDLPYTITSDGDGTVPRTSEIALLSSSDMKLVKGGLIEGDIAHADIPKNKTALKQVEQFLTDVTAKLSKHNVAS